MKVSKIKNLAIAAVVVSSMSVATVEVKADPATAALAIAGAGIAGMVGYNYSDNKACGSYDVKVVPSVNVVVPERRVMTTYSSISMPMIKETVVVEKPTVVEKYVPVYIEQRQSPTVVFY
jgi:hypothetical protein